MVERPYLILRPKIKVALIPAIIFSVPFYIIFFLLTVLDGGIMLRYLPAFVVVFLIFFVMPTTFIFFLYMNLRSRQYRFFRDRVEFYEGFLNITRRVVRYERITDVGFAKSVWDRLFGTGKIFINTAGSGFTEIGITYLVNPEKVYHDVQNILKRYTGTKDGTEAYRYRRLE